METIRILLYMLLFLSMPVQSVLAYEDIPLIVEESQDDGSLDNDGYPTPKKIGMQRPSAAINIDNNLILYLPGAIGSVLVEIFEISDQVCVSQNIAIRNNAAMIDLGLYGINQGTSYRLRFIFHGKVWTGYFILS